MRRPRRSTAPTSTQSRDPALRGRAVARERAARREAEREPRLGDVDRRAARARRREGHRRPPAGGPARARCGLPDAALLARARSMRPYLQQMFETSIWVSLGASVGPGALGAIAEGLGDPTLTIRLLGGIEVDSAKPSFAMWDLSRQVRSLGASSPAAFDAGRRRLARPPRRADQCRRPERSTTAFARFVRNFGSRGPNEWDLRAGPGRLTPRWRSPPSTACGWPTTASPTTRHDEAVADRERAAADVRERLGRRVPTGRGPRPPSTPPCDPPASSSPARERYKTNCIKVIGEIRICFLRARPPHGGAGRARPPTRSTSWSRASSTTSATSPPAFTDTLRQREAELPGPVRHRAAVHGHQRGHAARRVDPARRHDGGAGGGRDRALGHRGFRRRGPGRARVLLDPSDPFALEPGDILVTLNTDPSWTPLFVPAAGVVTEIGALGSHAMIVSRELGIPCVVSVKRRHPVHSRRRGGHRRRHPRHGDDRRVGVGLRASARSIREVALSAMAANGRRLHWYRSRFTRPAIAVAIGVLAYLLSLILGRFVFDDTDSNDAGSLDYPPLLVRLIVVPLTVPVLFSPFVLWQLWNSRRARWTGHDHQTRAPFPPPGIVDVCDAARRLRLRGDRYLAARFGACVLLAVASGVTLSPIVAVVAIGCLPLVWALSALHEQKYRPAPLVPAGSSVVRPKPTAGRRLLLWTAAASFQVTGVFLIVLGWMIVVLMVSLAPLAVLLGLKAPAVELVFGGPAIIALITVYLAGFSALARVGRRLRIMSAGLANQARARPFVLYLRAFVDDRSMIVAGGSDWWRLVEFFSFRARISLDEAVARRLGRTSSVVSIAEPASPRLYLPLGAARRRVSDDEWREFVVAAHARGVVDRHLRGDDGGPALGDRHGDQERLSRSARHGCAAG